MSEDLEFIKNEAHSPKVDDELVDALASDDEEEEKADEEFLAKLKKRAREDEMMIPSADQKSTKVVDSMLPEINTLEDLKPKKVKKKKTKGNFFIDDSEALPDGKDDENIITKTIKEQKRQYRLSRPSKANYDDI